MTRDEKLSDECLGVMKFAAATSLLQLALFGSMGGEQFYATMREGVDPGVETEKTERVIAALKEIVAVMGEGMEQAVIAAAK